MRVAAIYDIHGNLPALERAAALIRATSYPQAEEFADRNVLSPPSEKEILDAYTRVELR
jgi:hypothetical protein